MPQFSDKIYAGVRGVQPSADHVSQRVKSYIDKSMTTQYGQFMQARTAAESVERSRAIAKRRDYQIGSVSSEKAFFVTDRDMGMESGIENACAYVYPGSSDGSLRIIIAHIDSPCLRVTPQPAYFDSDALTSQFCPSFSVICEPYGGIRLDDWYGSVVKIVGNKFEGGRRLRRREIIGSIKQKSVHVEDEEPRSYTELRVDTGCRTLKELYAQFGVRDSTDFGKSRFLVVPDFETNLRVVGNEFLAYGQDDRGGGWAAIRAFERTVPKGLVNTMMVFLLDKEEVGGKYSSAGYRGFVEVTLKETLRAVYGAERADDFDKLDLPADLDRKLMGGMPALVVDLDIGVGPLECESFMRGGGIDPFNAPKPGWGFYVNCMGSEWDDYAASPIHLSMVIELMQSGLGRMADERFQPSGRPTNQDFGSSGGTAADIFGKYMPCVVTGVAGFALHNPRAESINKYDLYWLTQGLELYLSH